MAGPAHTRLTMGTTLINSTRALSIIRIATGVACFFAPQFTCGTHGYDVPDAYTLLVRMMGAREAINGGLLLTAEDKEANDGGRKSIQRALWVGLIADSLDICSVLYGFRRGDIGESTAGILGTAAAAAIGAAALMLRSLRRS